MRIGSYIHEGNRSYGVAVEDGIVDIGRRLGDSYPDLLSILSSYALDEAYDAAAGQSADFGFNDVTYLPLIPTPGIIYCAGINYMDHVIETGRNKPKYPVGFEKIPQAIVGHDQPLVKPKVSDAFDFEAELAVVIGRGGRHIPMENWRDHVAGYTCFMDGSIRDFQKRSVDQGKNFNRSSSCGPWLTTLDEAPEKFEDIKLTGRLNGDIMQQSDVGQLVFSIPEMIAYFSQIWEFAPGDIIATGTPSGVGVRRDPPVFMKEGDVFEVELSGIGVLRNPVINER